MVRACGQETTSKAWCPTLTFNRSFEVRVPLCRNGLFRGVRVRYSTVFSQGILYNLYFGIRHIDSLEGEGKKSPRAEGGKICPKPHQSSDKAGVGTHHLSCPNSQPVAFVTIKAAANLENKEEICPNILNPLISCFAN